MGGVPVSYTDTVLFQNATQDLFELLERVQSSRLDDQRCVLPPYFTQQLGFNELDSVNVTDCIKANTNEIDNGTLINTDEQREDNLDNDDCVETLSEHFMEADPNIERSLTIRRTINNAIRCYEEMYEEKRLKKKNVQTSVLQFLENKK
ncbi:hypothetical protein B7P43_G02021 [Cryptotermes secundus]|uniref:Uncharacterized protein n=1 Tax=Cryptotermes secundus TaxID=105785 RepID=A0A2J7Q968_9NEOP|nr:hypothetical protein B7P43_G02021 [Cryptotermes secundus]